jgi:putative hydrolase of the HAD superfamily
MSAIKAILFDMDDTLIDDTGSFRLSMQRLCGEFEPRFDFERLSAAYDGRSVPFWPAGDLREMRLQLWRKALDDCGYEPSLAEAVLESYIRHRTATCAAIDGTSRVLESLRGSYHLGVVTNGGRDLQQPRLEATGLAGYFDAMVCSSDIDAGKPDARIFEHALRALGIEAGEAWHIGDGLASDVGGALGAGLTAVWFNAKGRQREAHHPTPSHEITSLDEVWALLP